MTDKEQELLTDEDKLLHQLIEEVPQLRRLWTFKENNVELQDNIRLGIVFDLLDKLKELGYIKLPEGIEIICLCGSTKFTREMLIEQWRLTKLGCVVLSWCALPDDYFQGDDKTHIGDQEGVKAIVDQVHFRKIDISKEVRIMNIGGYIGESTTNELRYALSQNKKITFCEADSAKQILSLIRQDKE